MKVVLFAVTLVLLIVLLGACSDITTSPAPQNSGGAKSIGKPKAWTK